MDYGSHQRRKRIFIFASLEIGNSNARLFETGESVLSRAFTIASRGSISSLEIGTDVQDVSLSFNSSNRPKPFENSGASNSEGTITANSIPLTNIDELLARYSRKAMKSLKTFGFLVILIQSGNTQREQKKLSELANLLGTSTSTKRVQCLSRTH